MSFFCECTFHLILVLYYCSIAEVFPPETENMHMRDKISVYLFDITILLLYKGGLT